ncbi:hypothetical protein EXN66_Car018025 [Channa argus]|uniref:Uncharacterized protein n=1 Tax=Channa argus TaxID=215402 RepID=A0A6G1QIP3_CHAAH|nr:hypothetical protein EXN66_Car018025 [Channa argus]
MPRQAVFKGGKASWGLKWVKQHGKGEKQQVEDTVKQILPSDRRKRQNINVSLTVEECL